MPIPLILAAVQAGVGIYGAIRASNERKRQAKQAESLIANNKPYQISPYAKEMAEDARGRLNSVSPAVLAAMRQQDQSVANLNGYAQRNASSGAQALSLASAARGQANANVPGLVAQQDAISRGNRQNYYQSLMNLQGEYGKNYESNQGLYSDRLNFALGQMQAASQMQAQSQQNIVAGAGNALMGMSGSGTMGAFGQRQTNPNGMDYMAPLSASGMRQMQIPTQSPQVSPGWYRV